MRDAVTEVGPRRFRENQGRWFEDFAVGDVYEHRPGRTISEADNTWFTLLTMNTHPLHFDHAFAARTEFGRPLVVSTLTLAVLTGMSVSDVSAKAVANLGWTDIRLPHPVFHGDTLSAESEVIALRDSAKRPNQGVVTVRTTGHNQHGEVICTFERTMLIWKRGHGPDAV